MKYDYDPLEKFAGLILSAAYLLLFVLIGGVNAIGDENKKETVEIVANNPYSLKVELEVKCDWNGKEEKYSYYKKIVIDGKSRTVLSVPKGIEKCEIWPKIKWL